MARACGEIVAENEFGKVRIQLPWAGRHVVEYRALAGPHLEHRGHPLDGLERTQKRVRQQRAAVVDVADLYRVVDVRDDRRTRVLEQMNRARKMPRVVVRRSGVKCDA